MLSVLYKISWQETMHSNWFWCSPSHDTGDPCCTDKTCLQHLYGWIKTNIKINLMLWKKNDTCLRWFHVVVLEKKKVGTQKWEGCLWIYQELLHTVSYRGKKNEEIFLYGLWQWALYLLIKAMLSLHIMLPVNNLVVELWKIFLHGAIGASNRVRNEDIEVTSSSTEDNFGRWTNASYRRQTDDMLLLGMQKLLMVLVLTTIVSTPLLHIILFSLSISAHLGLGCSGRNLINSPGCTACTLLWGLRLVGRAPSHPGTYPNQMPKPSQLAPLNLEEQWISWFLLQYQNFSCSL